MRLGVLLLCASACTDPTSTPRHQGPVDDRPLEIMVTTDPPAFADGVARDAQIRANFDDYLDPDGVFFGPVVLKSGRGNFDADMRIDFVGRAIVVQPRTLLIADTTYELVIGPTVASLSGRTVGQQRTFRVDVGATLAGPRPPRPRVTWADLLVEGPPPTRHLIAGCAPWCHTNVGCSLRARMPTRQLNVETAPDDPVFGFINVPSVGMRGFAQPLLRVAPGDSARSQVMRKLVGGNAVHESTDAPYPDVRVDGRRMPMPIEDRCQQEPFRYFNSSELRLVQDWIDGGAPLN